VRRATRWLRARGTSLHAVELADFSAPANSLPDPRTGFQRRSLPGCAEIQTGLAVIARDRSARATHARFLGWAREDLATWRSLGGFLP